MTNNKHITVNYPAGDFLVQVKNAAMAENKTVEVRSTKLIVAIADALKRIGLLNEVAEKDGKLTVKLTYHYKKPVLLDIKLVSKPGLRIYMDTDELEARRSASELLISTPKGIKTSKEALKENVGGEVIAEIY